MSGQTGLGSLDGSTWDPFTRTLLFTQEAGSNGGVIEIPAAWTSTAPPARRSLDCIVGKAGYEGIHPDDKGNLILAEDVGGVGVSNNPLDMNATPKSAKQPNSFIYRFEPSIPTISAKAESCTRFRGEGGLSARAAHLYAERWRTDRRSGVC